MSVSTRPYIDPVEGLIARAKQTAAPLDLPTRMLRGMARLA